MRLSGEGNVRQTILMLCALFVFIVSFVVAYISFRTSSPSMKGLVGGGFFLLVSFVLLRVNLARLTLTTEPLGIGQEPYAASSESR
jgi:hypothetical protein